MASVKKEKIEVFRLQMSKEEFDALEKALGNINTEIAMSLKLSATEETLLDDIFNIM